MKVKVVAAALALLAVLILGTAVVLGYDHKQEEDFNDDCTGQTHWAHYSSPTGQVAVHGDSICGTGKAYLDVATDLYAKNGSFYYSVAYEVRSQTPYTGNNLLDARAAILCVANWYHGRSLHKVINGTDTEVEGTGSPPKYIGC